MELFIGGYGQNKLEIAKLKYDLILRDAVIDGDCAKIDDFFKTSVVNHFHLFVKRNLEYFSLEKNQEKFLHQLLVENPDIILIGDEIGCGIVPLLKEERDYREIYGRIMCLLAKKAQRVTRVVCGVCQVIKDEGK